MDIRVATIEDYDALNELFRQADELHHRGATDAFRGEEHWGRSEEFVREALSNPDSVTLVAVLDDEVVGCVTAFAQRRPELGILRERNCLSVDALVVKDTARRHGIGKALMAEVEAWGRSRGLTSVELTVWSFNESAIELYRATGYEPMTVRMRKTLSCFI